MTFSDKEYYKKNREKINARCREYYKKNREMILDRMKEYGHPTRKPKIILKKNKITPMHLKYKKIIKAKTGIEFKKIEEFDELDLIALMDPIIAQGRNIN